MHLLAQLALIITLILPITNPAAAEFLPLNEGIPTGMLSRVFPIRVGVDGGTCFVIDVNERQYLVTARHIVPTIEAADNVEIFHKNAWHPIVVHAIFPENKNIDAVALAASTEAMADLKLSKLDIPLGSKDVIIGQKVFFLGYPFGLASRSKNRNDLIPFVKAGILSAIDYRSQDVPVVYIDGHNNHGFSGGPVIFSNLVNNRQLQILAVISAYKNQQTNVMDVTVPDDPTSESKTNKLQYVLENSGIAIAYQLNEVVEAIKKHGAGKEGGSHEAGKPGAP
jgi:hypothetical protein